MGNWEGKGRGISCHVRRGHALLSERLHFMHLLHEALLSGEMDQRLSRPDTIVCTLYTCLTTEEEPMIAGTDGSSMWNVTPALPLTLLHQASK